MHIRKKKFTHGFSLLELIVIITITSIIAVPILSRLIISDDQQKITTNEINIIVKNTEEIYYSVLQQAAISNNATIAGYLNPTSNIDCNIIQPTSSINALLCKNNLGNNTRYVISVSTVDSTISIPFNVYNTTDSNKLSYSIAFYTRKSASSAWSLYVTVNREIEVPK